MRRTASALILGLAAAACVVPGAPPVEEGVGRGSDLLPTFSPEPTGSPDRTPADAPPGATTPAQAPQNVGEDGGRSPTEDEEEEPPEPPAATAPDDPDPSSPPPEEPAPTPPVLRGAVDDASGDVTPSVEPPPDHADLVRSEVIRGTRGFTIRHEVLGGAPPDTDEQHTQNIATFFDVDGDGEVDFHIWANLSSSGWGSAYFNHRSGRARYADEDDVDVHVDDDGVVVVRFPHGHLEDARSFRWSVGSEWGRYEVIGTDAAARDSAPEDHGSVPFPG